MPADARDADLALYIHWPFCTSKCPYCDFNSHVRDGIEQERWRAALLTEIALLGNLAMRVTPNKIEWDSERFWKGSVFSVP